MTFRQFQLLIGQTILFALLISIFQNFAFSAEINVNQQVIEGVVCNNNGICEPDLGENYENCPLDCPAPRPPAVFIPDTTPPVIYDLLIEKIILNSAEISWKTNELALCQLFFGRTIEYEKGAISETTFSLQHSTKLTNLLPATTYHFKISCWDTNRNESETKDQKFTTLALPDITPPANVSNFEAILGDSQIELRWQNPPDIDFKGVKIMRSEKFYPRDPLEGVSVYNNRGTYFIDTGLKNGVRYYYTAFTYDKAGNYSSGAIVSAVPQKPLPPEEIPEIIPAPEKIPEEIPSVIPAPLEIEKLVLENFDFIQKGVEFPLEEGKIKVEEKEPLTISIDYKKIPEFVKTIMITLEKDGEFLSFLLRANKEKTKYLTALIPPVAGVYSLTITLFDQENQVLKKISGQLEIEKTEIPSLPIPWYKQIEMRPLILGGIIVLIIVSIIIIYFIWRKLKIFL